MNMEFKICSKCKTNKPYSNFTKAKNKINNKYYYNSHCNSCRTKHNRNKYYGGRKAIKADKTITHRECTNCLGMFEYKDCYGSYCKNCWKFLFYDKDKSKKYTKKYRKTHKERWNAMHRLHQFNRKSLVKATTDGTVTDKFLKYLYSKEFCCWCNKYTEKPKRTIEHVIELSNGGSHTADNLDMACFSCNSSRKNRNVRKNEN